MLNIEIIPKETRQINQTSFEVEVFNKTIGFAKGYNYKFDDKETTTLDADHHQYFAQQVDTYKDYGNMLGTIAFYSSNAADTTTFLEVTSGFGNADMLMNFS